MLRAHKTQRVRNNARLSRSISDRFTESFATIGIWSALEIDLGVICACLPGMRLLISYSLRKLGWKGQDDSTRSHHMAYQNNLSSTRKKSTPGSTYQGSRTSQAKIRITTTIQQKASPSESQTYLPLGSSIELGNQPHGAVRAHAWA